MQIAIVTGASSGIGKEFVRQLSYCYPWLDEIWVIARREENLKQLQKRIDAKLRILPLDLRKDSSFFTIQKLLKTEKPHVKVLVNAAGFGKIGKVSECTTNTIQGMITLNCTALTKMTTLCLPYCGKRSHVIQIASAAAFVPQPGLAVYAATKSYVLSLSRALRREVKQEGITVTTVCPGPVDTEFFQKAGGSISFAKKACMAKADQVVHKAILDAAGGKELSVYGVPMNAVYVLCKIIPHRVLLAVMNLIL